MNTGSPTLVRVDHRVAFVSVISVHSPYSTVVAF